jgi:uncharacterized DUF497 family protein
MSDKESYTLAMSPLLRLDALKWDSWNLEHITKHNVTVGEILESLSNIVEGRKSYKERYLVFGTTDQGRLLTITIGRDPNHPTVWYVFSARDTSRKERKSLSTASGNNAP